MEFVFSLWYIVAIALVVGIVACLVVFFKMDIILLLNKLPTMAKN